MPGSTITPRALVVDDAAENRMLVSALLIQQGFAVDQAADGEAAVLAASQTPPDLIVLDIGLPDIEFDRLDTCSAERRVAFSRATLLERVWGPNWFGDDHLVDVHVSNLRRKLADDPRSPAFVATVRGVGYRMGAGR